MKIILSTIVLCAGKGTRMKSNLSKPLHKIGNLEMINHLMNTLNKLNSEETILVVSEENKSEIEKNINNPKIKTTIQKEKKGTGDATKIGLQAMKQKSDLILITMGDVPLIDEETYNDMLSKMENDFSITVLGFKTKNIQNKYGRLILNEKQELEKIIEYKDATEEDRKNDLCNAGIYLVKSDILGDLLNNIDNKNASGEYYLTDIVEIARNKGFKINFALAKEDEVMGINSREELAIAEAIFQDKKRKYFMKNGVTILDPKTTYFSFDTEIESDVILEPNVVILPGVKIRSGATIKAFSYLENCEIKCGAVVGPFARIRPESVIEENAKIGNFCEIKKSIIGKNTKVNHLSYIGDAEIGENTNIGAGTITCNYDGYKKFKTKIGKNSFIGSSTTMVAPISLGNNVLVGAGSVLIKDVEDESLTVARAEQKIIKEGMIKYRKKRE